MSACGLAEARTNADPVLRLHKLGVVAAGAVILRDIDLILRAGEFVGILGPNGSGKSTVLRCIAGLRDASSGTIELGGAPLASVSVRQRGQQLAMQTQEQPSSFGFTVRDVVEMGLLNRDRSGGRTAATADDAWIESVMERLDLAAFTQRRVETLSGGERQRVMLARAMAQRCPLLLLDEPTNHLDIKHRFAVLDVVATLDATVLAVLHEPELAARYCSRILLMKSGRIVADGPPTDVLTKDAIAEVYGIEADVDIDASGVLTLRFKPSERAAS